MINLALFKEQMRRHWIIILLLSVALLVPVVLPIYFGPAADAFAQVQPHQFMVPVLSMRNVFVMIYTVAAPLVIAFATLSSNFNTSAATVLLGMPMTKGRFFRTNAVVGWLIIVAPLVLLCLAILPPVRLSVPFHGPFELLPPGTPMGAVVNTPRVVWLFFVRMVIAVTFYYALFLLAVNLAGNLVGGILWSGALPFAAYFPVWLGMHVVRWHVPGMQLRGTVVDDVLRYSNPALWGNTFVTRNITNAQFIGTAPSPPPNALWPYYLLYSAVAVVGFAAAYVCFHKRRQERVGETVVFSPVKKITVPAMIVFGMPFLAGVLATIWGEVGSIWFGYAVGFLIMFTLGYVILEKTFSVASWFKNILPYGYIAAVYFVVVGAVRILHRLGE